MHCACFDDPSRLKLALGLRCLSVFAAEPLHLAEDHLAQLLWNRSPTFRRREAAAAFEEPARLILIDQEVPAKIAARQLVYALNISEQKIVAFGQPQNGD